MAMTGRDIALAYPAGMRTRLDADLTLTGETGALLLAGTVKAVRGLYDLDVAFEESLTAAVPEATDSPLLRTIALDVRVDTASPILVRNNLAELQATGQLSGARRHAGPGSHRDAGDRPRRQGLPPGPRVRDPQRPAGVSRRLGSRRRDQRGQREAHPQRRRRKDRGDRVGPGDARAAGDRARLHALVFAARADQPDRVRRHAGVRLDDGHRRPGGRVPRRRPPLPRAAPLRLRRGDDPAGAGGAGSRGGDGRALHLRQTPHVLGQPRVLPEPAGPRGPLPPARGDARLRCPADGPAHGRGPARLRNRPAFPAGRPGPAPAGERRARAPQRGAAGRRPAARRRGAASASWASRPGTGRRSGISRIARIASGSA